MNQIQFEKLGGNNKVGNYNPAKVGNFMPALTASVKIYWADPSSPLNFPQDWHADGVYQSYADNVRNEAGNHLSVPYIEPRQHIGAGDVDGVTVVGPLVWRPPAPESAVAVDGRFLLSARVVHLDDPSESAPGLGQVRLNNNIALRPAEVNRGPFPIGDQNTLVVCANFPDVGGTADESVIMSIVQSIGQWTEEITYGLTSIDPLFRGPVTLDNNSAEYTRPDQNILIEMTTEVLSKLVNIEPDILNGPTADPEDNIDRVIIVLNDPTFRTDWATTGHWPYDLGGETRHLSVSVQGPNNTAEQFAHGLMHQFALKDLYIHENVEFPREHVADGWDIMAEPFVFAHPLVWSKQHATWVTSSGGKIYYIARPLKGTPPRLGEPAIHINFQSVLESGQYGAIAIGLTEGATTFEDEQQFYWVEARSASLGNTDLVPNQGVLVYYANKLIPQGQAPVIVRDHVPSTSDIYDAIVPVGESESPAGTGIIIRVDSKLPGNDGYLVTVDYDPPPTDYNVFIRVGDPGWHSPDIWVDNQRTGGGYVRYDQTTGKSAGPVQESPVGGEENRIFARVYNDGPATAFDIEVQFHLSAPFHTVGGAADFDLYKTVLIDELSPNDFRDVFVIWEPLAEGDPHNCVRVHLRRLVSDINPGDNEAQQNLSVIQSSQASPYDEAIFPFHATNSDPDPKLVYFQVDGVPPTWSKSMSVSKRLLFHGETILGELRLQPQIGEQVCTDHEIRVTGWTPRGDTIIRLGGTTVNAQLRNRTELTLDAEVATCIDKDLPRFRPRTYSTLADTSELDTVVIAFSKGADGKISGSVIDRQTGEPLVGASITLEGTTMGTASGSDGTYKILNVPPGVYIMVVSYIGYQRIERDARVMAGEELTMNFSLQRESFLPACAAIHTVGCTNPPRPNEKLVVRYRDPAGNPVYHEVMTDEFGCYEDFYIVVEGGNWETTSHYPGNECSGSAEASFEIYVPLVQTGDQDGDGLLDADEVQGDDDYDGIPNQLDSDSDEDGVLDGDEPRGDLDGDGLVNVIDTDSDNDGVADGQDPEPYGPEFPSREIAAFFGCFKFDNDLAIEDNFVYGMRLVYAFDQKWSIQGEVGVTPTEDAFGNSGKVLNTNINALYYFRHGSQPRLIPFLTVGFGGFFYSGFSQDEQSFVVNGGLGVKIPVDSQWGLRLDARGFLGSNAYKAGTNLNYQLTIGTTLKF